MKLKSTITTMLPDIKLRTCFPSGGRMFEIFPLSLINFLSVVDLNIADEIKLHRYLILLTTVSKIQ